jgi:hypothetical protein
MDSERENAKHRPVVRSSWLATTITVFEVIDNTLHAAVLIAPFYLSFIFSLKRGR